MKFTFLSIVINKIIMLVKNINKDSNNYNDSKSIINSKENNLKIKFIDN